MNVAARAGGIALRIASGSGSGLGEIEGEGEEGECKEEIEELVRECEGLGGTMEAVGCILRACSSQNILGAKCVFSLLPPIPS